MTAKLWAALCAFALVTAVGLALSPPVFLVTLVGVVVFAGLTRLHRGPRGTRKGRHLVVTPTTAVAVGLVWLTFPTQSYMRTPLGAFTCAAVAVILVLDLVVSVFVTGKVEATARADRSEILVDDGTPLTLAVSGSRLPVSISIGPTEMLAVDPDTDHDLFVNAHVRGVMTALPVEVRSNGLCGLVGLDRSWEVPLLRPVSIGPRPLDPERPLPDLGGRWGEGGRMPSPTGEVVRGVRDYVPGDRPALVHWRASARAGKLVVKEVEEPVTPVLTLVLDLGTGDPAGERAAARAAWYLNEGLRRGSEVNLVSRESTGPRRDPVRSPDEVIRRLAAVVPGPPTPSSAMLSTPPWAQPPSAGSSTSAKIRGSGVRISTAPTPGAGLGQGPPAERVLRVAPEGDTWE